MELADRTLAAGFREAIQQGWSGIPYEELIEYLSEAAATSLRGYRRPNRNDPEIHGLESRATVPQR